MKNLNHHPTFKDYYNDTRSKVNGYKTVYFKTTMSKSGKSYEVEGTAEVTHRLVSKSGDGYMTPVVREYENEVAIQSIQILDDELDPVTDYNYPEVADLLENYIKENYYA